MRTNYLSTIVPLNSDVESLFLREPSTTRGTKCLLISMMKTKKVGKKIANFPKVIIHLTFISDKNRWIWNCISFRKWNLIISLNDINYLFEIFNKIKLNIFYVRTKTFLHFPVFILMAIAMRWDRAEGWEAGQRYQERGGVSTTCQPGITLDEDEDEMHSNSVGEWNGLECYCTNILWEHYYH